MVGSSLCFVSEYITHSDTDRVWVFHDLLTLFLVSQSRVTNVPLFLLFELQFQLIDSLELSLTEMTMTSLLFQYLSFFAFGGSNAISSIDLSNAYNGVSSYNVIAVGILTFMSNWAGPVWWTSATSLLLVRKNTSARTNICLQHAALLSFFVATSLLFVMVACTVLRAHLFIWTVFSPKYLYSMAWSLAQHLCINTVGGSILFWLAARRYRKRDKQNR
jgi:ethanolaminephosphotransferase